MTPPSSHAIHLPAPPSDRTGWPWRVADPPSANTTTIKWPRISVITPSYNQAAYLEECLRSVLLQDYPNLEFIVMDGGSTDGSVEILKNYAPHLNRWCSESDGGQGDAINRGFDRATGDILCWLNSDDMFLPGALRAVGHAFAESKAEVVFGDALNLYQHEKRFSYWQAYFIRPAFLQFGGVLASHATFWRRSIHQPIWTELKCNVDGELWRRLIPGRRLRYIPLPLAVYRAHEETKSHAKQWKDKWRHDDELIWKRHGRPAQNRIFHHGFDYLQRAYKFFTWRIRRANKRAIIAATGWTHLIWEGPRP